MINIEPFVQSGHRQLSPFLERVNAFIETHQEETDREDYRLRSRPLDTYLRNILAVGILNRLFIEPFRKTENRIIVLPDCLKNYSDWECDKETIDGTGICSQCHPDCLVYEAVERFQDEHCMVVLEPDDLAMFFKKWNSGGKTVGVVGVACVLTLMSGFQVTMKHKLPTQGMFLSYASCAHHWADPGYNTSFSFDRLSEMMGVDPEGEPDNSRARGETYRLEPDACDASDFYRRLDLLADEFDADYLPEFRQAYPDADTFELADKISKLLVPDLITRDSA